MACSVRMGRIRLRSRHKTSPEQTMALQPFPRLYRNVYSALVQLLPNERNSRLTNMVWLMVGIFSARSVQTGRLAAYSPLHVKKLSIVRRMERFLDNGAVRVRAWYEPIARWII